MAEEGSDDPKQSHTTIAVVEKYSDGTYMLKALKQKLYVDGLCYLLQEIYGIENKNAENAKVYIYGLHIHIFKMMFARRERNLSLSILLISPYSNRAVMKTRRTTVPNALSACATFATR